MKKRRIFIADDNAEELLLIRRVLRNHGFETILTAKDGAEAIARLSEVLASNTDEHRPDALVLDLHMPRHDGFEVLSWIKTQTFHAPVVIHTSSDDPTDQERAYSLGAAAFATKKAGYSDLISALSKIRLE